MKISKVYDNDDNRENNFDQKNSLSFTLRQALNQIKLNQKNSDKKRCYETNAGPHIHSLKNSLS